MLPDPVVVMGKVTGIERSIVPEHVVFRGLDGDGWVALDGCESPLTITTRDRKDYSALVDLGRHSVNRGDTVEVTLKSVRLHSVGMTVLLVTELRTLRGDPS